MTDGHSSHDSGSDPFLQAVASAPAQAPPSTDDRDPARIAHFRVVGRLGQGGMGIVYRAEDEKLRRTVAIKVLPRAFAQDPERRRRFLREARSAAAIAHPNIAAIYDVDEADGRIYLAMELVEGETLRARVERGPLPVAEAVRVARAIARGLARAHAKGVVHRDLKPDNVMLDADGEPKILDFGLAKLREAESEEGRGEAGVPTDTAAPRTEEGRLLGTPQYMSPEQAKGVAADARSDVFALGLLLHEMCAGRRAFQGASRFDVLVAIARDPHPPLRSLVPDAPRELEAIVDRCLAKAPADRYAEAGEVAAALDALVSSGGARSDGATAGPTPPPPAPAPRARAQLAPMVAVGIATLVVTGVLLTRERPSAAPPGVAPPSASAAAAPSPARSGRAATDWPPPATPVREAASAYAAGLQALRDGSQVAAARDFLRALELDPHLAAAHVRMALLGGADGSLEDARRHVAAATESRSSLEPRDLELLELARLRFGEATDPAELAAKAHAVATGLSDDAEAQFWAANSLEEAHEQGDEGPLLDRALALDPRFASVEHARARALMAVGDLDGAFAAASRCLALSPTAASCLRRIADVHDERGECVALEQDARELLGVEPAGVQGYGYLTAALAAQGAPIEPLRELAAKAAALRTGRGARRAALADEARLAIYVGDLAAAEAKLAGMEEDAADASDESAHIGLVWLAMVRAEEGAEARAISAASDFVRKLPAWVHDEPDPWRPVALAILRRGGRVTEDKARELAEAWTREAAPRLGRHWKNDIWSAAYALPAETESEARAALAALPAWSPLPAHAGKGDFAFALGRVYALAGDAEHALPLLRREATWCGPVPSGLGPAEVGPTIRVWQDRVLLGQALEQTGDRDGACAAYGAVLARWGSAKPRSVTAEKARARARALGCR